MSLREGCVLTEAKCKMQNHIGVYIHRWSVHITVQTGSDLFFCSISDETTGGSGEEGSGRHGDVGGGGLLSATQQREGPLW